MCTNNLVKPYVNIGNRCAGITVNVNATFSDSVEIAVGNNHHIINEETYVNCKRLKSDRNTQKLTDRSEDIYKLNLPILCPNCGGELHRRHDPRCKCKQRWFCSNDDCHLLIEIPDTELLQAITDVINEIIANPEIITEPQIAESETNNDVRRIENEIARTLDSVGFDKETLRKKMLECVSLKYKSIDSKNIITKMLKADFEKSGSLSTFSAELCSRTVSTVTLCCDKTVILTLINGQRIGKEKLT